VFHKTRELFDEIGVTETYIQMRQYLTDFDAEFHDVRASPEYDAQHDPNNYEASQALALGLLANGSNGIICRSVRRPGGVCIACFRPRLVKNIRQGAHFEYRWAGAREPTITELAS
jgi:hypothetical protein